MPVGVRPKVRCQLTRVDSNPRYASWLAQVCHGLLALGLTGLASLSKVALGLPGLASLRFACRAISGLPWMALASGLSVGV